MSGPGSRLLMCEDVHAAVSSATAWLQALAPECDAQLAMNEYPAGPGPLTLNPKP